MNTILFVGEHPKTYDVRWHTHESWELVYCTEGEGAFRFENGTVLPYRAGELVAIPPRLLHTNSSQAGFANIHMNMAEPSFPARDVFRVEDDSIGSLRAAFAQAKTYYMTDIHKRELVLEALGALISSYITVFCGNAEFSTPVKNLRESIIQNFSRTDYALDEVIRQMPFHYDYIRKLFKKEIGVSPLEYITRLRMRSAEMLLTTMWTNEYTVSEIARMCGYDDALYFSRVFKKYFGCSPSSYVKKQEQIHDADPSRREIGEENGSPDQDQ